MKSWRARGKKNLGTVNKEGRMHLEHKVGVFVENTQPLNLRYLVEDRVITKIAQIHLYTTYMLYINKYGV
jgi:hypothetical protein